MMFCTILVDLGYFDIIEIYFLVVGHTHCPLDQVFSQLLFACSQSHFSQTLGAASTVVHNSNFIASPIALRHLLTSLHQYSETYTRPSVFRKIEVIYDVKKAFLPLLNRKINKGFFPHCYKFQRHKKLMRAHTLYRLFSDHEEMPPDVDGSHEASYVEEIDVPEFGCVGGKKNFFHGLGLNKSAMDMTTEEAELAGVVKDMEAHGVFDEMQDIALTLQATNISKCMDEEVQDESVTLHAKKKRAATASDSQFKGLLCWVRRGTTIDDLEAMQVDTIVPGENDRFVERTEGSTVDEAKDTAPEVTTKVSTSKGLKGSKEIARACNYALQELECGRIRLIDGNYTDECFSSTV
jgi:hypothetical protein